MANYDSQADISAPSLHAGVLAAMTIMAVILFILTVAFTTVVIVLIKRLKVDNPAVIRALPPVPHTEDNTISAGTYIVPASHMYMEFDNESNAYDNPQIRI